jgi:nucleotide-binding universal stress UspA family protein
MYRHLLVPLDNSPLSVESVRHAVELARALGSKVTFFHAKSDYAGTSVGALVPPFALLRAMLHYQRETKVIMPAAQKHLTADDWAEIGAAFAGNGDPRFSVDNDEEFRQLFARILNLAPAPVVGGQTDGSVHNTAR